jgi:hypothetical protein
VLRGPASEGVDVGGDPVGRLLGRQAARLLARRRSAARRTAARHTPAAAPLAS